VNIIPASASAKVCVATPAEVDGAIAPAKINVSESPLPVAKTDTRASSLDNEEESWTKLDEANIKQGK
jgi:hypothetical protein